MPSLSQRTPRVFQSPAPGRVETTCATCGATLYIQTARFQRFPKHFCNSDCQRAYRKPLLDRLMEKVEKQPNGCWRYRGSRYTDDHTTLNLRADGRGWVGVHVVAYELMKGPIPDGCVIDHVRDRGCIYKDCINPDHLEPVTQKENTRRALSYPVAETCIHGHPRTPENTSRRKNGAINWCLVCRREQRRAKKAVA